jgi:uncharacterized cupredoxin-like copper-binding protein
MSTCSRAFATTTDAWRVGALAAALALGPTACGGDDQERRARTPAPAVRVVSGEYTFAMPDRVKGGVTTMNFVNAGKELHEFSLGRLDPGKTLADLDRVLASGREPPGWLHDVGGVPAMSPRERISITRRLRPGRYVFLCFVSGPNGKPHYEFGMKRQFTVAGDTGAAEPKADGLVVASDKRMEVPVVRAGRQTLELRNAAQRPRGFELVSFEPGKTPRDLERWGEGGFKGKPPATLLGAMQSIAPGTSVFLTASFERGRTYYFSDDETNLRGRFNAR